MITALFLLLGFIGCIAFCMFIAMHQEENKNFFDYMKQKHGMSARGNTYRCVDGDDIIECGECYVWKHNGVYKISHSGYVQDLKSEEFISFSVKGQKKYVTEISGGGGGGTSISGAIIGGAVAGPVGAVIGSRKKSKPVKSEIYQIGNVYTVMHIKINGRNASLTFEDDKLYYDLMSICPEKEIKFVKRADALRNIPKKNKTDSPNDVAEKLMQLKKLFDDKLISQGEYETKKADILKDI